MIELTRDADHFAQRVGALLWAEVETNLIATTLVAVQRGRHVESPPRFAIVTAADGSVVGGALRTPPRPLLCSALAPDDARALLAAWLPDDPELPAVSAPPATAREIGAAWAAATGGTTRLRMALAWHLLDGLHALRAASRPAPGRARRLRDADRALAEGWWRAYAAEALGETAADAERSVDVLIAERRAWVWEDAVAAGGALSPVCLVAHSPAVTGTARIAPVYTPPGYRSHGYASSAVAAVSLALITGGARRCVLTTDLANPTSNRIYADVGYRPVGEWEHRAFVPQDRGATAD